MSCATKIPSRFRLMGHSYRVVIRDDLRQREDVYGRFYPDTHLIELQGPTEFYDESNVKQTFYHELVHAILMALNEEKLSDNEQFVDLFGSLLHQFERSRQSS